MTDAVDKFIERVIVDAYGDDEQLTAFEQWFDHTATLPFPATVVGVEVAVTAIENRGDEQRRSLTPRSSRVHRAHGVATDTDKSLPRRFFSHDCYVSEK